MRNPVKTRVLVLDDDQLVADTLSLISNANGYECEARYSATGAFDRVCSSAPALVLCDLSMPKENGWQLAERIRQSLPEIRLLLLTAYADYAAETLGTAAGVATRLTLLMQPRRPDDLLRESRALFA